MPSSRSLGVLCASAVIFAGTVIAFDRPAGAEARSEACAIAPTEPTTLPELSAAELSAAIADLPSEEISGALVQVRGSAGCWHATAGTGDVRTGRPVPDNARFRIGSMTKVFTAVVALQLVAEGRLGLDSPVQQYLPGLLPADYAPITVRQMLTYTSGINHVSVPSKDPDWFLVHRYDRWSPGSQLDLSRPPAFAPGTKQRYGNADYILAGLLIERVTGHRWEREVTDRIITPLRLSGTSVPIHDRNVPGPHARGYEATDTGWVDVTSADPSLQWSAAAIISTADDLDRLLVALFSGRLLPPAQLDLMFTVPDVPAYDGDQDPTNDRPADYAVALSRLRLGPVTIWAKSGDRPGYTNAFASTRDLSRRLVYSTNTLHMGGGMPAAAIRIVTATYS